jgi:enoyl-CoA hydratase/carnithine racemase
MPLTEDSRGPATAQGTVTSMDYEFATYEKQGRIAIVTINRPERMNALHPPANFELHEIWNDFEGSQH